MDSTPQDDRSYSLRAIAAGWVDRAAPAGPEQLLAGAQVFATLAVEEELGRLREVLQGSLYHPTTGAPLLSRIENLLG